MVLLAETKSERLEIIPPANKFIIDRAGVFLVFNRNDGDERCDENKNKKRALDRDFDADH